jgi:TatA/E family protein of Tat protein translocase
MQTITDNGLMLALFNLGGGEIILIFALVLIFFGAEHLPYLARRLGRGLFSFRDAADDEASEAGRSVGGIFGKRAAQTLTPDNRVAELYNPAAFDDKPKSRWTRKSLKRFLKSLWDGLLRLLSKA